MRSGDECDTAVRLANAFRHFRRRDILTHNISRGSAPRVATPHSNRHPRRRTERSAIRVSRRSCARYEQTESRRYAVGNQQIIRADKRRDIHVVPVGDESQSLPRLDDMYDTVGDRHHQLTPVLE